jgi:hypothetical protein
MSQSWRTFHYYCTATLKHAHGITYCTRRFGHDDNGHVGICDTCAEYGEDEYVVLEWTGSDGETVIWPRPWTTGRS